VWLIALPSDIDILSFYLSGKTPSRVSSFGSIHHFKPSQKPKEAGDAKRCFDCAYEPECVWSAKKIYIEPLNSIEDRERVRPLPPFIILLDIGLIWDV
jgi:hypothetical protein